VNKVDSQGRKQGKWQKTYPGSRVFMYKGQFKNDKPVGKFTYFYKDTKVKAIIKHDENSTRSVAYFYHPEGTLMSAGIYRNMKKDSVWMNFTPSQRLSTKETYKNDSLHGLKTIYFIPTDPEDKTVRISAAYVYDNGKLHGKFKEFFLNGITKAEGEWDQNQRAGIWFEYHPNGKRALLTRYKEGKKHGWQIAYDENMKRLKETYFYYGTKLEGEKLDEKLKQLEEKGIDPNK
jgi:antitoxin component YwqK of YwqJK toxin-antitoxin module